MYTTHPPIDPSHLSNYFYTKPNYLFFLLTYSLYPPILLTYLFTQFTLPTLTTYPTDLPICSTHATHSNYLFVYQPYLLTHPPNLPVHTYLSTLPIYSTYLLILTTHLLIQPIYPPTKSTYPPT